MRRLKLVLQTQFPNRHRILAEGKAASFAAGKPTSNRRTRREPAPSNHILPILGWQIRRCIGEAALPILVSAQEGLETGLTFRVLKPMYHLSKNLFGEQTQLCWHDTGRQPKSRTKAILVKPRWVLQTCTLSDSNRLCPPPPRETPTPKGSGRGSSERDRKQDGHLVSSHTVARTQATLDSHLQVVKAENISDPQA